MATATEEKPGSRIEALAKPKRAPPEFLEDRRSVYWVDYLPPRPGPNGTTEIIATPRVQELARHRPPSKHWRGDRPSPLQVSKSALNSLASQRIKAISLPNLVSPFYQFDRPKPVPVSKNALKAKLTSSIEYLAKPRYTQEQEEERFKRMYIEETKLPHIPDAAKIYQVSNRIMTIALPRVERLDELNPLDKPDPFAVKSHALRAMLSERLNQLSIPKTTRNNTQGDAYKVSQKALTAKCTPRLKELCIPVASRQRTKKVEKKSKKKPFRL